MSPSLNLGGICQARGDHPTKKARGDHPTKNLDLDTILSAHDSVFREELGTIHPFQAKLHVRPDSKPKFCKARPVPFAIKGAIDQELERLETASYQ